MSTPIFGPTTLSRAQATAWGLNTGAHQRFLDVMSVYFQLCPIYGIPVEVALGQASWETNNGKYTGVVIPEYHNWCGLKTKTGSGDTLQDHQQFPDDETGVEAHLQHLSKYGGHDLPAGRTLFDPRWSLVTFVAATIEDLGGHWAPDSNYGVRVAARITAIKSFEIPVQGDTPLVFFYPASIDNYTPGRSVPWPDTIVHHHTDGYDSLAELTVGSRGVSATYLMNHDGSPRYQLVRHADTPHTNSGQNFHTLTVEWERKWPEQWSDVVPDSVHVNLGKWDAEIVRIERRRGNPNFLGQPVRAWLHKHNDYASTTCPGNLNVDRIYSVMVEELKKDTPVQIDLHSQPAQRDPWRELISGNHYGTFYIINVFVDEINANGGFWPVGFAISGAFIEQEPSGKAMLVQYFERARLELHLDGSVTRGLLGLDVLGLKHPELVPR